MPFPTKRGAGAWRIVLLVVVVGTVAGAAVMDRGARRRPNVLLVSIDSLRADHVGAYGHPQDTTPTIDALARDGALFAWAITSAPWTIPAHATLLTGLPPEVHGVTSYVRRLAPDAVTLAEALRDAGWDTAAFVSGPTVSARYGFDQGFASFDESVVEQDHHKSPQGATSPGVIALVDGFLQRWSDDGRRQPFFVFLHLWDVHYDYAPPPPYDRMFDPGYVGDLTSENYIRNPRIHRGMDPRELDHVRALYDGEIRFTDDHLGRLIARLRELGVLDDTIVVVTSDHGDEFFEHGLKGHAVSVFDEVVHVPLVIRYPRRIPAGLRIDEQVRLMDVPATILGLANVPPPQGFAGAKLAERHRAVDLSGSLDRGRRDAVPVLPAFSQNLIAIRHESVRTRTAKLITVSTLGGDRKRRMLFDLAADPGERTNLARTQPAPAFAPLLQTALDAWHAETARQTDLSASLVPQPAQEERLRALGYVQ
jgi:arylsulfatase A-like enzyme